MDDARRLRADAQHNEQRILMAAARAFRAGRDTSLRAVAREAGVGIGTLYRRFPTREHLVEAVYRADSERLCESVPALLEQHPPLAALRMWMEDFLEHLLTKEGMAGSLRAVLADAGDLRMQTRGHLLAAMRTLMTAAIAEGSVRADVDPQDVLMTLGGIAQIITDESQHAVSGRLVDLLVDGLRWQGGSEEVATQSATADPSCTARQRRPSAQ
ncbi:TetR/AcrR family transcriptional regulator [Mycobacterium sp. GA-2829]|uniref:TetR/AcrR family transcriptional regulator n=1 Tax=Mycobacterium sp. GA-2829 TaxID=1772283 RepID=UPI0018D24E3B|nr:TetR/AcrR family transcriptional regulator [Mycobacterium sp. GA-2829]